MDVQYSISKTQEGWAVSEDGVPVTSLSSKQEAFEIARLLALGVKATGGRAALWIEDESGTIDPVNVDRPI